MPVQIEQLFAGTPSPFATREVLGRLVEIPESWSQNAARALVDKYFRKAGVPSATVPVPEDGIPEQFWRSEPAPDATFGGETSAAQVFHRLAGCWAYWGLKTKTLDQEGAENLYSEIYKMLACQFAAPNTPQWLNSGLHWAYGLDQDVRNYFYVDTTLDGKPRLIESTSAYQRPAPMACLPYDELVNTDRGLLPIGEVVEYVNSGMKLSTYDRRGNPTPIVAAVCNGKRYIMRLDLADGSAIRLTGDHVVFVDNGEGLVEKHVSDLVPGVDHLALSREILIGGQDQALGLGVIDAESAWAGGLMVGNGYSGRPTTATSDTWEIKINTEAELIRLRMLLERRGIPNSYSTAHWGYTVRGYGTVGKSFWDRMGLWNHTGDKIVPGWVLRAPVQVICAFLRGLFDTDGHADEQHLNLSNTSRDVVEKAQVLLRSLGIFATLRSHQDTREENVRKLCYQLSIYDFQSRVRFAELVGFTHSEKQELLEQAVSAEVVPKKPSTVRVEARIKAGAELVYDIQTAAGEFWAAGRLVHNCFIQAVDDSLIGAGGIMDLIDREARVFRMGGGSGTNVSAIRGAGEPLSGGGKSSGLMSFLKVGDRSAGAIKSGGTSRRAAKLWCLDLDHPDIEEFIDWKSTEERKVAALVTGAKVLEETRSRYLAATTDVERRAALQWGDDLGVPRGFLTSLVQDPVTTGPTTQYDIAFEGEAYYTVSGQNANNSVRVSDDFMHKITGEDPDDSWNLYWRTDGSTCATISASETWRRVCRTAWLSGDPGVQFDTTINAWNTCLNDGRINGSNPCSEFMHLDDTPCNLASLNLARFFEPGPRLPTDGEIEQFVHAVRLWTIILDISVSMAQYPSDRIAWGAYNYRTLGLGYTSLGSLVMSYGYAYDSDKARDICSLITSIMTGAAYNTSAELAEVLGAFPRFEANREHTLRVLKKHADATLAAGRPVHSFETQIWDEVLERAEAHGVRNAQVTLLAPCGTIGIVMDNDTTGIEPAFSLMSHKTLVGGGSMSFEVSAVGSALTALRYDDGQIGDILDYLRGSGTLEDDLILNPGSLARLGLTDEQIELARSRVATAISLDAVFEGFDDPVRSQFSDADWRAATIEICGARSLEGAPHLRPEHLAVFDCAVPSGHTGTRQIHWSGHLQMMAAAQPFLSGAQSKTVNVPTEATVDEISEIYLLGWRLGLKAIALYRDGSKLSQPLSSGVVRDLLGLDDGAEESTVTTTPAQAPRARRRLPNRRRGHTQKVVIDGHKLFLRTGEYEDGSLGEIFVDMHKQGTALRAFMDCFAQAVSIGLQHGVPLEKFVEQFVLQKFEPNGVVMGHDRVTMCTSIIDFLFRDLAITYLGRDDLAHVSPESLEIDAMDPMDDVAISATLTGTETLADYAHAHAHTAHKTAARPAKPSKTAAQVQGFTGNICPSCGAATMVQNGTCMKCVTCGETTGCS